MKMKKYNLAFLPVSRNNDFIKIAQQFSFIADEYLLGDKSLPHVTLYQFEATENQLEDIWNKIRIKWGARQINLEFDRYSYITFDKETYWISLLPKESCILYEVHREAADILQLQPMINYDSHLTLVNTKNAEYQSEIENLSKIFLPITDSYQLALGESDDIGQYYQIVFQV